MATANSYDVLGVRREATDVEIKAAYTEILNSLKTGKLPPDEAMARLNAVRGAYRLISESRAQIQCVLPKQPSLLPTQQDSSDNRARTTGSGSNFLANLNVFIPAWVLMYVCLGTLISLVVMVPLGVIGYLSGGIKSNWTLYLFTLFPHLVIGTALSLLWFKKGLVPTNRKPERERRYRIGHIVVGITTVVTFIGLTLPFLIAELSKNSDWTMLMWLAIPLLALACLFWAIGLYMILSSRAHRQ